MLTLFPFWWILGSINIFRAGGRLDKAEDRLFRLGLVRVGGLGGREGATQEPKRIFGYEIHFKRDLPRDVESINQKAQLKSLRSYFWFK